MTLLHIFEPRPIKYPVAHTSIPDGELNVTPISMHGDDFEPGKGTTFVLTNGLFVNRSVHEALAGNLVRIAIARNEQARVLTYDDPRTYNQENRSETAATVIRYAAGWYGPVVAVGQSRANITHAAIMPDLLKEGVVSKEICTVPAGIVNPYEELDASSPGRVLDIAWRSMESVRHIAHVRDAVGATAVARRVFLSCAAQVLTDRRAAQQEIFTILESNVAIANAARANKFGYERSDLMLGDADEFFNFNHSVRKLEAVGFKEADERKIASTHLGPLVLPSIAERIYDWAVGPTPTQQS